MIDFIWVHVAEERGVPDDPYILLSELPLTSRVLKVAHIGSSFSDMVPVPHMDHMLLTKLNEWDIGGHVFVSSFSFPLWHF